MITSSNQSSTGQMNMNIAEVDKEYLPTDTQISTNANLDTEGQKTQLNLRYPTHASDMTKFSHVPS